MNLATEIGQAFAPAVRKYEIDKLLAEAIDNHQTGRLLEAAQGYQRVIQADEKNVVALNNLSLMLNDEEALKLLTKALEVQPNFIDAMVNKAVRYLNLGFQGKALDLASRANRLDSKNQKVNQLLLSLGKESKNGIDLRNTEHPEFSVIIPTHNRAGLLARALSSIKQQNNSVSCEVIVVSDFADEKTDAVCREWLKPTDTYIRRSGIPGPSASRNLGLKIAKGRVVLFLDDDDAWHNNLLADLTHCEHLKKGLPVYFNSTVVKESRTAEGPVTLDEVVLDASNRLDENIFVKNQIHMSSIAIPTSYLKEIEFDTHMRAYEDWDFMLSIFERIMPSHAPILGSKIYEVEDKTTDRRGSSKEANDYNAVLDYLYVYRRHSVSKEWQIKRAALLRSVGLNIDPNLL